MQREENDRLSADRAARRVDDRSPMNQDRGPGPGRDAGRQDLSESSSIEVEHSATASSQEAARLKAALEGVIASLPEDLAPDLALMRRLQHSEARYKTLVSLLSNIVWVSDAKLRLTQPNPEWERFTGQSFEEYRGTGWTAAIHPEDRPRIVEQIDQVIRSEEPIVRVRYRLWRTSIENGVRSGGYRHCEATAAPVRDHSGEVVEWVGMLQDRTEQHEFEEQRLRQNEQLSRSNRDLEDFAFIAAHDLKEPLRGIRLIASFLAEDTKGKLDEDGTRRLAQLQDLCARMQMLLDSLLESAKVASVPLAPAIVEVPGLVAEAAELVGARINESGASIDVTPEARGARVYCDPARMAQVIANLIANGIKYNEAPLKTIEVGLAPSDDAAFLTLYVRDNGIGIPQEQQEQVFRMFRRLHPREVYGGGAGAGLAIVKKIVERHGGRIWIESAGPGQGTTFFLTIPAHELR